MITNSEFDRRAFLITPIAENTQLVKMARATLRKSFEKHNPPIRDKEFFKCNGWRCGKLIPIGEEQTIQYPNGRSKNYCHTCYAKKEFHEIATGGIHR